MYDFIGVEKLETKNMIRKGFLSKSISEQTWGKFVTLLAEKAERAGRVLVAVDPRGTSQNCSGCGATVKKDLSVRTHNCKKCGVSLDRDLNAARNILLKGVEKAAESLALELKVLRRGIPAAGGEPPSGRSRAGGRTENRTGPEVRDGRPRKTRKNPDGLFEPAFFPV